MKFILSFFAVAACTLTACSQGPASPAATATGSLSSGANITITYNSPGVKGRQIWGGLVPYDKVWRAGANKATVLETDKEIEVGGKKIPAGKYSLYAIPREDSWTIILNSATGQWGINRDGSTTEDPEKDVVRVDVKPGKAAGFTEQLTYAVEAGGFSLTWENLKVTVPAK